MLRKTTQYRSYLVALERPMRVKLVAKNPLPWNNISATWRINKIPSAVSEKGIIFVNHGRIPVWILESTSICLRHRRQTVHVQFKKILWLLNPVLEACPHLMRNRRRSRTTHRRRYRLHHRCSRSLWPRISGWGHSLHRRRMRCWQPLGATKPIKGATAIRDTRGTS